MPRTVRRPYVTIQAWLDATGTQQDTLARRVGISPQHLSNVIRKTRNCSLEVALRLQRITNVPIEAIASDNQLSDVL